MKIRKVTYEWGQELYLYMCPGCGYEHAFGKLTVSPSLLMNWNPDKICHSYIEGGNIQFLPDCSHHLKGLTVELPEYINLK